MSPSSPAVIGALLAVPEGPFLALVRTLFRADDRDRHWSRLAAAIGRIEDEGVAGRQGYASARAFCAQELDVPPRDFHDLLGLWRMMQGAQASGGVLPDAWLAVPKAKAVLLRRALRLGGHPAEWLRADVLALSVEQLRGRLVTAGVLEAAWVELGDVPGATRELVDASLVCALPALPGNLGPAAVEDPAVRHQLFEVVAQHFIDCPERRRGVDA